MNILIINGSPRGEASNSLKLARAFANGIASDGDYIEELNVSWLNISDCHGCFACWSKTPGKCCINDDMTMVLEKQMQADVMIWSFPLYYYSVPGKLKTLIDRQLPMVMPFMVERGDGYGSGAHPGRYDMSGKRNIVVSTCGFWSADGNYDCVDSMFSHILGRGNFEKIYCGEGELFRVKQLEELTGRYLGTVTEAGREYVRGGITVETRRKLSVPILPKDIFEEMANASW